MQSPIPIFVTEHQPQRGNAREEYYRSSGQQLVGMQRTSAGGGLNYWYHNDGRQNVAQLSDSNGAIKDAYRYDPYGELLPVWENQTHVQNHLHNDLTLTGKAYDERLGMTEFGFRLYDAEAGSWLNQDYLKGNLREPRSLHRYQFVYSNPLRYIDLYGLQTCDAWVAGRCASPTLESNVGLPPTQQEEPPTIGPTDPDSMIVETKDLGVVSTSPSDVIVVTISQNPIHVVAESSSGVTHSSGNIQVPPNPYVPPVTVSIDHGNATANSVEYNCQSLEQALTLRCKTTTTSEQKVTDEVNVNDIVVIGTARTPDGRTVYVTVAGVSVEVGADGLQVTGSLPVFSSLSYGASLNYDPANVYIAIDPVTLARIGGLEKLFEEAKLRLPFLGNQPYRISDLLLLQGDKNFTAHEKWLLYYQQRLRYAPIYSAMSNACYVDQ